MPKSPEKMIRISLWQNIARSLDLGEFRLGRRIKATFASWIENIVHWDLLLLKQDKDQCPNHQKIIKLNY